MRRQCSGFTPQNDGEFDPENLPVDLFNDGIANNHGGPYMGDIEREYHFLYIFFTRLKAALRASAGEACRQNWIKHF